MPPRNPDEWHGVLQGCDYDVAQQEIARMFQIANGAAERAGGSNYYHPELVKAVYDFLDCPNRNTASSLLTIAPMLAPYFEQSKIGSKICDHVLHDDTETESSNQALDFIRSSYSQHPCTGHLIRVLPDLTKALCDDAEEMTANLLAAMNLEISAERRQLLAKCVLDLELVSGFDEIVKYANDIKIASCYVDAVVCQATGEESSDYPIDTQYRVEGTQSCRGVAKYRKAKEYFKVSDPTGWLFCKEFAAIVHDDMLDIGNIFAVMPLTFFIRAHGGWRMRWALTGKMPTDDEQRAVTALVDKLAAERYKIFDNLPESAPEE